MFTISSTNYTESWLYYSEYYSEHHNFFVMFCDVTNIVSEHLAPLSWNIVYVIYSQLWISIQWTSFAAAFCSLYREIHYIETLHREKRLLFRAKCSLRVQYIERFTISSTNYCISRVDCITQTMFQMCVCKMTEMAEKPKSFSEEKGKLPSFKYSQLSI